LIDARFWISSRSRVAQAGSPGNNPTRFASLTDLPDAGYEPSRNQGGISRYVIHRRTSNDQDPPL